MGQQQLLMIVLSIIIVGIAVVIGIGLFSGPRIGQEFEGGTITRQPQLVTTGPMAGMMEVKFVLNKLDAEYENYWESAYFPEGAADEHIIDNEKVSVVYDDFKGMHVYLVKKHNPATEDDP